MWIRSEQLEHLGNEVGGPEDPKAILLFLSLLLPHSGAVLVAVLRVLPGDGLVTVSNPVENVLIYKFINICYNAHLYNMLNLQIGPNYDQFPIRS